MSRQQKFFLSLLVLSVIAGGFAFRSLQRRVVRLAQRQNSEEQARREVITPPISTPSDVRVKAKIFWASDATSARLEPVEVELPLSADPVQRSKQLLRTLVAEPPTPAQRTIPAGAALLSFYVLPDSTAIADFSDSLATETPSGILSEQMAVDSIARTLEANVSSLLRLKVLIHGQETETLAGHLDLTGFFDLHPAAQPAATATSAPLATPGAAVTSGLTPSSPPGKLKP